jgi:hypothetical protein
MSKQTDKALTDAIAEVTRMRDLLMRQAVEHADYVSECNARLLAHARTIGGLTAERDQLAEALRLANERIDWLINPLD